MSQRRKPQLSLDRHQQEVFQCKQIQVKSYMVDLIEVIIYLLNKQWENSGDSSISGI